MESLPFALAVPADVAPARRHRKLDLQSRSELEVWTVGHLLPLSRGLDHHSDRNLWDCLTHHTSRESWCSIPLGYVQSLGRRWDIFLSTGTVLMGFDDSGIDSSVLVIDIIG